MHRHQCPPKPSGSNGDEITGADQRRPYPFLGRSIGPASGTSPALALCRAVVPGGGNPTVPPTPGRRARRRQHRPRRGSLATARAAAFPPPVRSCRRPDDRPRAARTSPRNRGRGSARRASNPARAAAASMDTDLRHSASAADHISGLSGPPCPAPSGVISPFQPMRPLATPIRRRIGTGG